MSISRLMAVDGTGLLVRCSRAAKLRQIVTSAGVPTGTLAMFAGSLSRYAREIQPDGLVIAWDGYRALRWRREIVPEYKAGRAPFSVLASREASQAWEFCEAAGMTQWQGEDFEADDLLAHAACQAADLLPEAQAVLVSDDADILQLAVAGHVVIVRNEGRWDAEAIEKTWGVPPPFMTAMRALAGDRSDGIPGVRGIGRAKALKLLRTARWRWPLPNLLLDPADKARVERWHSVMDLIDPPRCPSPGVFDVRKSAWSPQDGAKVQSVLDKYELTRLSERNRTGILWSTQAAA